MSFGTLSALVAGLISLVLAISVLIKGNQKPAHRAFAQLSVSIFIWNIGFFLFKETGSSFWHRSLFVGVLLIPPSALHFVLAYLPHREVWQTRVLRLAYVGAFLLFTAVPTPVFYSKVWVIAVILFVFPLLGIAVNVLLKYASTISSVVVRRRLQFLAIGGIIAGILGATDFLPGFGIPIPQLGPMAVLVYLYAVAMGIFRYHLFDIPEVLARTIVLFLQVLLLSALISVLTAIFGNGSAAIFLCAMAATLLLLLLEPLRRRFQREANLWFTKDYKEIQRQLGKYSNRIARITDLNQLEQEVIRTIENFPGVRKARLITKPTAALRVLLEKKTGAVFVRDDFIPTDEKPGGSGSYGMFFPIRLHHELLGAVELQEEEGQTPYSSRELRSLTVLANQVAAAIVNLQAQEEIRKKEKLAAIGELAAGLAHEIRNPLASIKGAANYLKGSPTEPETQEFLGIIRQEVDRLNTVVAQFLDYARPFKKDLSLIPIGKLVRETVKTLLAGMSTDRFDIHIQIPEDLPAVEADSDQITQVVWNLVLNGLEAMPDGGLLVISAQARSNQDIEISFEDEGMGIPKDQLDRLFEPFFTTKEKGTGLGLAICYRIIDGHGGTIEAETESISGTRFKIRLPVRQAQREIK